MGAFDDCFLPNLDSFSSYIIIQGIILYSSSGPLWHENISHSTAALSNAYEPHRIQGQAVYLPRPGASSSSSSSTASPSKSGGSKSSGGKQQYWPCFSFLSGSFAVAPPHHIPTSTNTYTPGGGASSSSSFVPKHGINVTSLYHKHPAMVGWTGTRGATKEERALSDFRHYLEVSLLLPSFPSSSFPSFLFIHLTFVLTDFPFFPSFFVSLTYIHIGRSCTW